MLVCEVDFLSMTSSYSVHKTFLIRKKVFGLDGEHFFFKH